MTKSNPEFQVYPKNILIDSLPPIMETTEIFSALLSEPEFPDDIKSIGISYRHHLLSKFDNFHLPSMVSMRIFRTIDKMIRSGYVSRNPHETGAWSVIHNAPLCSFSHNNMQNSATVVGESGVGKSTAIKSTFAQFPQVISHDIFPNLHGKHNQLVWLSVDAPRTGKTEDFAAELMNAFDHALLNFDPSYTKRFSNEQNWKSGDGSKMLAKFKQVALTHFLGILHIDEIQNFFSLPNLKSRRNKRDGSGVDLSIVEDRTLKLLLEMSNNWMPIIISGTPDGIQAFEKRAGTSQRFAKSGYHQISRFPNPQDVEFNRAFLSRLFDFQLVDNKITLNEEFSALIYGYTAGIKRLIIMLWKFAHEVSFDKRGGDTLKIQDFTDAYNESMRQFESLIHAFKTNNRSLLTEIHDTYSKSWDRRSP